MSLEPAETVANPPSDPRYPVGKPPRRVEGPVPTGELSNAIADIAELPSLLRNAVHGLDSEQLGTPYRVGGWSVRQVVSHLADSHMMAVLRVRLALTEEWPTILAYNEKAFAELHDSRVAPVEWSLELIEALHARWVMLLQSLTPDQWERGFRHPERGSSTIANATLLYAWHCRHHLTHITHLRAVKGW